MHKNNFTLKEEVYNLQKKYYSEHEKKTESMLYIKNVICWKMKIVFNYGLWPVAPFTSIG